VGGLTAEWADALGLEQGTAVSAPIIDAHAAVPGCGVTSPGQLVIILGTSSCHMLMGAERKLVPGIQGVVDGGILPGYFGYEAGQAATGDVLDWYVERLLGNTGEREAAAHRELTDKAARLPAGSTGLLVLDWWNGNRSILINPELSGLIVGITKGTRPEELYRALIEGTAFGTLRILENFAEYGVPVNEIYVCGGVADKNELLLQVYADVTGRALRRAAAPQVCALGAAMFGAVAAGAAKGGHDSMGDAVKAMVAAGEFLVQPVPGNEKVYRLLYKKWCELHDYFGRGANDVMAFLRTMRSRPDDLG
jgi:L-ribulokinase